MRLFSSYIMQVHPDFQEFSDFINTIPARMARQEGSLIYQGRNEIREIEYKGVKFVIKSFHRPNLINRFVYGLFRASKAERSFQNAVRLLAIGVGTPQPVAFINMKKHGLFDRSFYISLHSACSHVYNDLFEKHFDYEKEVLQAVGRTTAVLHEHGLAHLDYGRGNILFEKEVDHVNIELVDLNRMYNGPIDMKAGCKNLERLPATPQMHRWLAEAYAGIRHFDAETCFKLIQAYRSTQPGKIDDKY